MIEVKKVELAAPRAAHRPDTLHALGHLGGFWPNRWRSIGWARCAS